MATSESLSKVDGNDVENTDDTRTAKDNRGDGKSNESLIKGQI